MIQTQLPLIISALNKKKRTKKNIKSRLPVINQMSSVQMSIITTWGILVSSKDRQWSWETFGNQEEILKNTHI